MIHAADFLSRAARLVCLFDAAKPAQKDCTVVRPLAFGVTDPNSGGTVPLLSAWDSPPVVASIELVVATIIGVFAFSESMTIIKIVGILLVLLSILLFSWKSNS